MQAEGDRLIRRMQDELSERVRGETTSDQQERMDSPLGQALFRRCTDWTDLAAADRHPETERNRAAACREFRDYVLTGAMPD